MKKYFLIPALLTGLCIQAFCQSSEEVKIDSIRLDSLKSILPLKKDSARVDLLNQISSRIAFVQPNTHKLDSMFHYASIAYNEANKIGYKSGIAKALIILSGTEGIMGKPVKDGAMKEQNIRKAIQLAEESNNYEVLGSAYYALSGMPSMKDDFAKHLDCFNKAIYYFNKAGNILAEAEITNWICGDYLTKGEYEKAFDYGKKAVELSKKSGTDFSMEWRKFLIGFSLHNIAELHSVAGYYKSAMNFYRDDAKNNASSIARLFCKMGQYDSALVYWKIWRSNPYWDTYGKGHQAWGNNLLGQIYLANKQYDSAIRIFKSGRDTLLKYHSAGAYATIPSLLLLSKAYEGKKNYTTALQYAKKSVGLAQDKNQRPEMMEGYQVLSSVYHHLGNNDSAYEYLQKYMFIKDSIQNKQFLLRMYNSKKEAEDEMKKAQLGFLMKDNKIKQQQLKEEDLLKNFLFIMLAALIVAGIFIFRNLRLKRKNDQLQNSKQQAELQERATRLEMQALRAQMNPHFIFNCLSSINCFILENETEKASDYLTRFSRLIRMVLTNSEKSLITLDEELKMLRLYLDMERLRFENSFDYNITYTNNVEAESVLVPPLLLQPFCENAIWHGLMNKDGQGHLNITIIKENEYLNCIITDNGIGRAKAGELNMVSAKKEKSMGLKITNERLSLFNQEKEVNNFYEMEDVINESGAVAGTKVSIKIRHRDLMEAVA